MRYATQVLEDKIAELLREIKQSEWRIDNAEMNSDIIFAESDISNLNLQIDELRNAIKKINNVF